MNRKIDNLNDDDYQPNLTRRESFRWLGLLSATIVAPDVAALGQSLESTNPLKDGHWPNLKLTPISASGYGKDPNLIMPPKSPWPRTLTKEQLNLVAVLCDILVPREGSVPSASEVNVPEVIDEWISAPYPRQQTDRLDFLHGFAWLDDESELRFGDLFVALSVKNQQAIIDDIAFESAKMPNKFKRIASVFSRFRRIVLAAFFCSPEGSKDLGYIGNVAIAGDYPGPTTEAMNHLNSILKQLGL